MTKKYVLALGFLGSLPAVALAQTTVQTQVATDGQNAADIHWLVVPSGVATAMYVGPTAISAVLNLNTGVATLTGNITGTPATNTANNDNGRLGPIPVPAWTNGTKSTAFGLPNNYSGFGNTPVAIGVQAAPGTKKYLGSSTVALSDLSLTGPDGRSWSFQLVAADAESTDQPNGESYQGVTDGADWTAVASLSPKGDSFSDGPDGGISNKTFKYDGSTKYPGVLAIGHVLATRDPSTVSVTLKAGTSGGNTTAQAMALGAWPLAPEVTVDCPAVTPPTTSQACNVTVVNPPREPFIIHLAPPTGVDPASSCLTGVSFASGQTGPLTCNMQMPKGATGTVNAPAQPIVTELAGWKITPSQVTLNAPAIPPEVTPVVAPVPVGGIGLLALITSMLAGVAAWSLRNRRS